MVRKVLLSTIWAHYLQSLFSKLLFPKYFSGFPLIPKFCSQSDRAQNSIQTDCDWTPESILSWNFVSNGSCDSVFTFLIPPLQSSLLWKGLQPSFSTGCCVWAIIFSLYTYSLCCWMCINIYFTIISIVFPQIYLFNSDPILFQTPLTLVPSWWRLVFVCPQCDYRMINTSLIPFSYFLCWSR